LVSLRVAPRGEHGSLVLLRGSQGIGHTIELDQFLASELRALPLGPAATESASRYTKLCMGGARSRAAIAGGGAAGRSRSWASGDRFCQRPSQPSRGGAAGVARHYVCKNKGSQPSACWAAEPARLIQSPLFSWGHVKHEEPIDVLATSVRSLRRARMVHFFRTRQSYCAASACCLCDPTSPSPQASRPAELWASMS